MVPLTTAGRSTLGNSRLLVKRMLSTWKLPLVPSPLGLKSKLITLLRSNKPFSFASGG